MVPGEGGEEWRSMDSAGANVGSEASRAAVAAAEANIERIRKRDVQLRVVDRTGTPVEGLAVQAIQKRHELCFGDNLWQLDRLYRFGKAETDRGHYFKRRFAGAARCRTASAAPRSAPG